MSEYTTKAYAELFNRLTEDQTRSGHLEREARTITDESRMRQVNMTNEEAEDFEKWSLDNSDGIHYWEISSYTESDLLVSELIEWLEAEDLLEEGYVPNIADKAEAGKVSQLVGVWEDRDGKRFVTLDGVDYLVDEPVGTAGQFYAVLGDQYAQRDTGLEKSLREVEIITLAREQRSSGDLEPRGVEIDDDAKVSEGDDNGAYVQAWVWVPFEGTPLDKEKQ